MYFILYIKYISAKKWMHLTAFTLLSLSSPSKSLCIDILIFTSDSRTSLKCELGQSICFSVRITDWRMKEKNGLHLYSHSFVTLIALLTSDTGLWHFKRLRSLIMWSASPGWLMFLNTSHIPAQGIYCSSI